MPLKRQLGTKDILTDLRRINTGAGLGSGSVKPHNLLGSKHTDAAEAAPSLGAMILADSTSEWNILLHPVAAGYALVTSATTVAWDQTPTWTGDHTWDDGTGDSPANVFVGGSNDDTFSMWLEDDAVAGNSDFVIKFPAADGDSRFIWRDSGDADLAAIDADGDLWFLNEDTGAIWGGASDFVVRLFGGATIATSSEIALYATAYDGAANKAGEVHIVGNTAGGHGSIKFWDYDGASTWVENVEIEPDGDVILYTGDLYLSSQNPKIHADYAGSDNQLVIYSGDAWNTGAYIAMSGDAYTGNVAKQGAFEFTPSPSVNTTFTFRLYGSTAFDPALVIGAANNTVAINAWGTGAQLVVDQSSASGAMPVLKLDQGDVSEQCIKFSSNGADQDINLWTIDVTGTPKLWWDESEDSVALTHSLLLAEDKYIGLSSTDLRIMFDGSGGVLDVALGDAAGADEFRVVDSGGVQRATIDSDGNTYLQGHQAVGAESSIQATQIVTIDEIITANAGNYYGIATLVQAEPSAGFTNSYEGIEGFVRLDTAQVQASGSIIGMTGRAEVNSGIAATVNLLAGGNFYCDVEDATGVTDAVGAAVWTPIVDTGACTDGIGLWVRAGLKGAGTITNKYGIYIDDVANGSTLNYSIYAAGGVAYFAADGLRTKVATTNVDDVEPTDAQLDTAFGTPATVGEGFVGIIDDNNAETRVWMCVAVGSTWWRTRLYLAP